jgi:hypothetical protein
LSENVDCENITADFIIGGNLFLVGLAFSGHSAETLVDVGNVAEVDCILGCTTKLDLNH